MNKTNVNFGEFPWGKIIHNNFKPLLSDLTPIEKMVFENHYQIGEEIFACAPHQWNSGFSQEAKFVNRIYWCESVSVLQQIVSRPDTAFAPIHSSRAAPQILRLAPECISYGQLTEFAKQHPKMRSKILPRFAKDYTDNGTCFIVERFLYYFITPCPIQFSELPCGIAVATTDKGLQIAD